MKPVSKNAWIKLQKQAHQAVSRAVKSGKLPPATTQKCVDCGKKATEYDHRDYTERLVVSPVCRGCNKERGPALPPYRKTKRDQVRQVPIQYLVPEDERTETKAQALARGHSSVRSYLRKLVADDACSTA